VWVVFVGEEHGLNQTEIVDKIIYLCKS
jgi:hypothetical protein